MTHCQITEKITSCRHFLQLIALISAMLLAVSAYAAPTRIVCDGRTNDHGITGAVIIQLDDAAQSVTLISSSGQILAPNLGQPLVTRYDSTEIDFHRTFSDQWGRSWNDSVVINRLTGSFLLNEKQAGKTYLYSGTCTKAEQRF